MLTLILAYIDSRRPDYEFDAAFLYWVMIIGDIIGVFFTHDLIALYIESGC